MPMIQMQPAEPARGQQAQPGGQPAGQQHPAYAAAIGLAMKTLYRSGGAEGIAKAMRAANDPAQGMADIAYQMLGVIDERTQGQVPDELLISLAAQIVGEVAEIAEAAGVKIGGGEIATATQGLLLRYVEDQGLDPTQLKQAMGKVDPARLGAALESANAQMRGGAQPPQQPQGAA